ncbi:emp24/gp25L/p24 family of membrane trafficking proteins [Scheffersomyces stipitis CBS 6054]|uniref:Emp24/gp25L/p24 family of membrane trafficking proteins n=1 Tax=Scheffersomyces stipitis (strain ATCC 58785 / CBS 6054 / NBRC 10063 / NRRL Y-11545) TaxID=322104 RepID=A3LP32_PICST|nr:emp24/gp25L/p24 family of membrane trafficking proteins [Scheffersomyces stipitis CBS 6054]ABN64419.2 emp24/gp25L/p24 family of membrane trafficking proteins [Scheffersomyces stipitis CBS 6054]KAG2736445.1 hypothetical protein G9P44_000535 [Scheffersomyces stipitis]
MVLAIILWSVLFLASPISGLLHFYAAAGVRTCFYKELGQKSLLVGRYKVEIRDEDTEIYYPPRNRHNIGALIDVEETFDSNHRVVHQKGAAIGQFTFSALDSGDHRICITPRSFYSKKSKWYGGNANSGSSHEDEEAEQFDIKDSKFRHARITIDFLISDEFSADSKHSQSVETLASQVNRLNDKLTDIKREQKFIREKEAVFRDLSESTCGIVIRWSIIQLGALGVICVYQLLSLSRFFVKQKVS